MKKKILYTTLFLAITFGLADCRSKKITCPAYGGASDAPGAIPKHSKTTSGVLPTDGRGTRTVLPR